MYQLYTLIGRLGADPELRKVNGDISVCSFPLAVSRTWTKDGERHEDTTWFRVTCWRGLADTVNQYMSKGRQVLVTGDQLKAAPYLDKKGEPAASLELTANTVRFLGGKDDDGGSGNGSPRASNPAPGGEEVDFTDGDVPW